MKKFWRYFSIIFIGIVIGLGLSLIASWASGVSAANFVSVIAIIIIIGEFFERPYARKANMCLGGILIGIAVREHTGMSLQTTFIITFVTIVVMVTEKIFQVLRQKRPTE